MAYDGTLKFDTSMDASGFQKDANKLDQLVKGLGIFEIIKKGMQMVGDSIGAAVSRYDTLNKFPAIMEQMGYGAENGEKAIKKLSDGIKGLPTTLDSIVSNTKQLTIATGDLDKGVDTALALNNAFFASGAASGDAARGAIQYTQMLSSGKVDMQSWRTLNETMTYALQKTAESFGFAGTAAKQDLYEALQSGRITFTQFNDRIIELNAGVGGFAEVSKTASGGIGTSWTNMQTAVVRGTTGIISAIDNGLSKTRFVSIENIIGSMKDKVVASLELVAKGFGFIAENADTLVPALAILTAGIIAYKTATSLATIAAKATGIAIDGSITRAKLSAISTALMTKAKLAFTTATGNATAALALMTAGEATAAQVGAMLTVKEAALAAVKGVLAGQISLATAAQLAWNAAFAASPIGVVIASAAVLVGGVAALDSAMSASTAKHRQLRQAASDLVATNKDLLGSIRESATAYQDRSKSATTDASAAELLAKQIYDLADAENKSESEKQKLKAMVDQLNAVMPSLNLQYNIERDLLSKTADETYNLIAAKKAEAQQIAAQERAVEIAKEQISIDEQLLKTREQLAELESVMGDRVNHNTREGREQLELKDKLIQAEAELSAQSTALGESLDALTSTMVENSKTHDTATANLIDYGYAVDETTGQVVSLTDATEEYGDTNQEVFDLSETEIKDYAKKFKMSADDVRLGIAQMGGDVEAWVAKTEKAIRAAFVAEDAYIEKIKTGQVEINEAYIADLEARRISGEEMTNIETAYLGRWQAINDEMAQSATKHTDSIINNFERLPTRSKMSLEKMVKNLKANNAQYAAWKENLKAVSDLVGPETAAALESMGPGLNKAIEKALKGGSDVFAELAAELGVTADQAAALVESEFGKIDLSDETKAAMDTAKTGLEEKESELEQTAKGSGDTMSKALEEGATTSDVAQAIADEIVKDLTGADYTGITASLATAITTGATDVVSSATTMSDSVLAELETMKTDGETKASNMMTSINTAITTNSATIKTTASTFASDLVTKLEAMVTGAETAASNMMAGILKSMDDNKQTLYDKAKEIADKITKTLKDAWDEHSPSKVSYGIMEFFMLAMFNAMDDMEGPLLGKALDIADGLTSALSISPEVGASLMGRLQAIVETSPLSTSTLDRLASPTDNPSAGPTYNFYMTQHNTSPKPLSESELTRNANDMFRRIVWQLP